MKLTEHFALEEFQCHCGCGAALSLVEECRKTAEILEALRGRINEKQEYFKYRDILPGDSLEELSVVLSCGVRCPTHNAAVGGKPKSRHLSTAYEGAADTHVPGLPADKWYEETKGFFKGRILYKKRKFVHLDRRVGNSYNTIMEA